MTLVPMATIAVGLAPIIRMARVVAVQQEIVEPTVPWNRLNQCQWIFQVNG